MASSGSSIEKRAKEEKKQRESKIDETTVPGGQRD
jgi:hypothetical protein